MGKNVCRLCGCDVELKAIERYSVIPREIMEQAGIEKSKTVRLCPDCREELERWCANKVADMTYDTRLKRFRSRSPVEMAREYEIAYQRFTRYKKEQQRTA